MHKIICLYIVHCFVFFYIFNSFPSLIGLIFWRDAKGTINFEQPEANFAKKNYCNLASSIWYFKTEMSMSCFRDKDILKKSGQDAIQYLTFQRYLIIYTTIVMVLVVAIVVPVNFSGNNSMCIDQVITTVIVWLTAFKRSQMEEEWRYWSLITSYLDLQYFLKGIFNTMKSMELVLILACFVL